MTSSTIDLDAYFNRIGYAGPRTPTLDVLREIHARHTESIAFENLNPFMRWPVLLDLPSLEQKIVHGGRGGYCFEHNLLFREVLTQLGFKVTGLAARVLWGAPSDDTITPRGHMLLRVDIGDQPYIADVGFGGPTPTSPLRLAVDVEQSTVHEPYRLLWAGEGFKLQARIAGEWKSLYRFDLVEQFPVDYEVTSYYLSNNPRSHFVMRLMAARAAPGRRYTLRNNSLMVHHLDGPTEQRILTSVAEIQSVLQEIFRLTLPVGPELDAGLARLLSGAPGHSPVTARELDHVVLSVRDQPRMQAFYCDVLGCTVEKVQAHVGLVQLRAGRSLIDLVDAARQKGADSEVRAGRNMDHFCMRIEPFDVAVITAHLRAHGVEVGEPASRYGAEGEGPSIYLQDPEGNTVELKGPPDA